MPGLYLLAIVVSTTGIAILDARFKLAMWDRPVATTIAVLCGLVFFLMWDAVGITTGVFIKGDTPLLLGIDVAPQLPFEELFFLTFLCYLGLVVWAAAHRTLNRRAVNRRKERSGS